MPTGSSTCAERLRDGQELRGREGDDLASLGREPDRVVATEGLDERLDRQGLLLGRRARPATRHRVRADGVRVVVRLVLRQVGGEVEGVHRDHPGIPARTAPETGRRERISVTRLRREGGLGAAHQQRHLVADQADVAGGVGGHRQHRAVADVHEEHELRVHLDDGLPHLAAAQAGEPAPRVRLDMPETIAASLVAGGAVELVGHCHQQAVGGHDERVLDAGHALHEVVEEPGEVGCLGAHRRHGVVLRSGAGSIQVVDRTGWS
ncbi:hypothetical protein GCM10025868_21040 [Angustibacter aerolatus]|uniref:Uncharacterized protein n=1 Tax=Angustibacter aerolatus TaxID=1162965 RepID=A0ABQ6JIC9_9ACTN|nr:hypothetical protein GCM10025868_21040 [Angustibacter aerolatus]